MRPPMWGRPWWSTIGMDVLLGTLTWLLVEHPAQVLRAGMAGVGVAVLLDFWRWWHFSGRLPLRPGKPRGGEPR